jgi:hypothetical protein
MKKAMKATGAKNKGIVAKRGSGGGKASSSAVSKGLGAAKTKRAKMAQLAKKKF